MAKIYIHQSQLNKVLKENGTLNEKNFKSAIVNYLFRNTRVSGGYKAEKIIYGMPCLQKVHHPAGVCSLPMFEVQENCRSNSSNYY